jgi:hypothetical protein
MWVNSIGIRCSFPNLLSLLHLGAGHPMTSNQQPKRENYQSDDDFIEAMAKHYEVPLWMVSKNAWEKVMNCSQFYEDDSIAVTASVSCGKSIVADMAINPWRPIDTAPKDGSFVFLGFFGKENHEMLPPAIVGYWERDGWFEPQECYQLDDEEVDEQDRPTHWMPIPPPPNK